MSARQVPDLNFAKRRIPIDRVADFLGLERHGRMIRCWRPDNHEHGDRTPSVGIQRGKNRAKCFVCDARALSTVDLVSSVLSLDTFDSLLWLANQFQIPDAPSGKHMEHRSGNHVRVRVGVSGNPLEAIVRSGLYAHMSDTERRVLTVLVVCADPADGVALLSYAGLRRFSGISKDSSVSRALKKLRNLGMIEITKGIGGDGLAICNRYRLTLESTRLLELMREANDSMRDGIAAERVFRAKARLLRAKALREKAKLFQRVLPVTTLGSQRERSSVSHSPSMVVEIESVALAN